ncbi:hypothetical protein ASPZODRAFT_14243 [Penicilliopsis zonata CBS 506.65]|uniref:Uncharacterized protein n=1 Tax=Penicilliopsis zonata CBS 506.65 TaxID=1073090 RepID=A0A1L9SLI9_9EURO|nr:hypothetical protein ASPZODRAFT_14243 [Penicilliopsis zonata CBS 506.65]OJJ48089.1 hypothetical protein ASPZODRAFT_14243 [Penicilliopsis zonata CBS 506.65]
MRYEHWDVLLFPERSKVPVQEFKTQCFVTREKESPYLHNPSIINPASYWLQHSNLGQLPVLTTFIPSLPHNTPFRVSIHSWEKPRPSRVMESLMQPDDSVFYETRVFIDGLCVAGTVFGQRTTWPHVIEFSSHVDKSGNQDHLRFPPFHQEILEQRHWDAGELHGRIRIVIAEGFARPHRSPPFERVKDIISFSFQHAPLHVLEYSNIAWPNAGMWTQAPRNVFKYQTGSTYGDFKEAEDTHAHSPTRHETRNAGAANIPSDNQSLYNAWLYRNLQAPAASPWQNSSPREPGWPPSQPQQLPPPGPHELFIPDPFIEPFMLEQPVRRNTKTSLEDISMPDYASSASSRAISSMTGVSYEHSKQPSIAAPTDEEQFDQLVKSDAPVNFVAGNAQETPTVPSSILPMGTKPSAAAEARSASYARTRRASSLKDLSQPPTREVSGSSVKSIPQLETTAEIGQSTNKLHVSPCGQVRSKKEAASQENRDNEMISKRCQRQTPKDGSSPSKTVPRMSENIDIFSEPKRKKGSDPEFEELMQEMVHITKDDAITITLKTTPRTEAGDFGEDDSLEDLLNPQAQVKKAKVEFEVID